MRRWVVAALVMMAAGRPLAGAQVERATISGVVREGNIARPGVTVRATHVLLETTTEAQTDQNGRFEIPNLRPGPYVVSVSAGALAASVEITIQAAETRQVELLLRSDVVPPPPPAPAPPESPQPAAAIEKTPDFVPAPDRWRLKLPPSRRYPREVHGEYPQVEGRPLDPYNLNTLKGDRPIIGDRTFFVLTGVSETVVEYRKVPTPSGVSAERPGSDTFFGNGRQYAVLPTGVASFELFHGDTAFRPRDWAVRVTPVFNLNYVHT